MKIQLVSDLHLEFAPLALPDVGADVVVLAGDIDVGLKGARFAIDALAGRRVVYVAGNHEYYGRAIPRLTDKLRAATAGTSVHFLDENAVVLDGVRFLGCTLWTDFNVFGAERAQQAEELARFQMTDFRRIRRSPGFGKLTPRDTVAFHRRARAWLRARLDEPFEGPTVVVTHHSPTPLSNAEGYRDDLLSAAFVSDLSAMMSGDKVKLWMHGHTHHCGDVVINGTRVVSNQRGYHPMELVKHFDPGFVVDV